MLFFSFRGSIAGNVGSPNLRREREEALIQLNMYSNDNLSYQSFLKKPCCKY